MAWTYGGDPSANSRDYVRFRIGDTDTSDQLLTDEEINGVVSLTTTKQAAAYLAAKGLLAKWSRFVDSKMGKLDLKLSQRLAALRSLLPDLEEEADTLGGALGVPYMAAHSKSARETIAEDTDLVDPAFAVAMHDFHERSDADSNDDWPETVR